MQCLPDGCRDRWAFGLDGFALRIGIGLLIAGQSMIFGLAVSLEESTPAEVKFAVQGIVLAGTLLVIALLGWPLLRAAALEVGRGRLTIEALFLLTMIGAFAASLQSFISGTGPIYFEVVSILLAVYSLGQAIGSRRRSAALEAAWGWVKSIAECRRIDAEGERMIDAAVVQPGDRIAVHPGESIAVDGTIESGTGFVYASAISGESFAVVRRSGDRVLAGAISVDASFVIVASVPGGGRVVDSLIRTVEAARGKPASIFGQADRLGRAFFPIVVATALLTFAVWTQFADWRTGLFNAMSVLLVACPCAIGLAAPIVVWSTVNRLAERGLVPASGDFIERLARVDRVMFDKTGTLTDERFAVIDIATREDGEARTRLLGWLSLVESQCRHPIARALAGLPRPESGTVEIRQLRIEPGCGVSAEIVENGRTHAIQIGRPEWIGGVGSAEESTLVEQLHAAEGQRIDVAVDGRLAAVVLVAERLREAARETLAELRRLGLCVGVLSGDAPERLAALDLPEAQGGLLPDDKRRLIEAADGKTLMVGDGINDAPALAAAHVSIALASGVDLARAAADATLHHDDLRVIPWAVAVCRGTMRTIRFNLLRAAAYNVVGITLAAFGILHPVTAAILMVVSSLLVVRSAVHAGERLETPPLPWPVLLRAAAHAFAVAAQGLVIAFLLLRLAPVPAFAVILGACAVGVGLAWFWARSPRLPHDLDMAIGMFTLGNLGMLLGWWVDLGFAPFRDAACCNCVQALRDGGFHLGMWLGMYLFANTGMIMLARRPIREMPCRTAMFTGGNLGMGIGMLIGAWAGLPSGDRTIALGFTLSFGGMAIGMIAGMIVGARVAQALIDAWTSRRAAMPVQPNNASIGLPAQTTSGRPS